MPPDPILPLQLFHIPSCTYTYILHDPVTREAVIIDPVDEMLERDLDVLAAQGWSVRWILETHAHADHITSAAQLAEHTGAHTAAPQGCGIGTASRQLVDGEVLLFGAEQLLALHTPGHTAGSMCYVWRNHVFTGDTLLIDGCGRTDFQSGDALQLYRSITERLFTLLDTTTVWPGHDYKGRSHSTIGIERKTNSRLAGRSEGEFVAFMRELGLPAPKRLNEAVPANLQSGLRQAQDAAVLSEPRLAQGYAGDISPELAWEWVQAGRAVLVDVRTDAEREWVGYVPGAVGIAWRQWPGMVSNPDFDQQIQAAVTPEKAALILCRSGVRSIAAAKRATELGLRAYNVLEGFEGDPNAQAQRGQRGGWRYRGLPWRQG